MAWELLVLNDWINLDSYWVFAWSILECREIFDNMILRLRWGVGCTLHLLLMVRRQLQWWRISEFNHFGPLCRFRWTFGTNSDIASKIFDLMVNQMNSMLQLWKQILKSKSNRKEQRSVKLALEKSNTYRGLGFVVEGGLNQLTYKFTEMRRIEIILKTCNREYLQPRQEHA